MTAVTRHHRRVLLPALILVMGSVLLQAQSPAPKAIALDDYTKFKRITGAAISNDGKWMHYSIQRPTDKTAADVFDATMKMLETDPEMKFDRERLVEFCCSPTAPVMIQGRAKQGK